MVTATKKIILAVLGITIVVSSFFPAAPLVFAQVGDGTGEGTVLLEQPPEEDEVGTGTVLQGENPVPLNLQNPTADSGSAFEQSHQLLPSCSLIGEGDGTFEGCMIRMIYYVILYPSAWLAGLAGQVFDYFVAFTLNSNSYRSDFIEKGWRIIRDIANISFIFILLFLAFRLMFGSSGSDIARSVSKIILVALIINFSLFATRVIVDVGNIMGRAFYSRIVVSDGIVANEDGFVPLSVGVISQVNPQKLLSARVFQKRFDSSSEEQVIQDNNLGEVGTDASVGNNIGSGYLILIMLIAAAINLLIGWTFMSVVLFLLARTVGLWLLMIMSPLSFASVGITFLKGKGGGGFSIDFESWYKQSLSLSFMVVVFMFFLYLTIMFLSDVFGPMVADLGNENASTLHFIMSVLIPISIVYFLLSIARTQAKAMAGAFGEQITSLTKKALMVGLGGAGLALGATAVVGGAALRQTVGRAGKAWAKNANTATGMGRFRKMAGTWASKNSWDARNIKIPKQVGSTLRSGLSYGTGSMFGAGDFALSNVGRGTQGGGYAERKEERIKRKVEQARRNMVDEETNVDVTRNVNGQIVPDRISVEDARRQYNRRRTEVERNNNYQDHIAERDRLQQVRTQTQREFEIARQQLAAATQMNDTTAIAAATQSINTIRGELTQVDRDLATTRTTIQNIEDLWRGERDVLNQATARINALRNQTYQNYANSIRDWNPTGATGRGRANRGAADDIEDLSYGNNNT